MSALNARLNTGNANQNSAPGGRSFIDHLSFVNIMTVVMGLLAVKERWYSNKDRQEELDFRRTTRAAPQLPPHAAEILANAPPYRDDPSTDDIGLDANAHTHLLDENVPPVRPVRRTRRSCCVCCGIRCDIVFKALGIVLALYLFYGVYKVIRWATTPSLTGLEDMPEYSTSLGCSAAPHPYASNHFEVERPTEKTTVILDITGGAIGTVLFTQSETQNVVIEMDLRTDEEPLLQKVTVSLADDATTQISLFRLSTPSSTSSPDACMRFDLTVQIPTNLRMLSLRSQSLVHVKYNEHAPISLSDLTVDLLSPVPGNLLLPHERLSAASTTLKMRGGYLVGSLAFVDKADISTRRGSAITNLRVSPLPAPASSPDGPARLVTGTGSGRADVTYLNPERRVIANEHTSAGGDMYLTYQQAGYNGRVDVHARSRTSSGLEGTMAGPPNQGTAEELPWVGDKEGADTMKVRTTGWVGLYF